MSNEARHTAVMAARQHPRTRYERRGLCANVGVRVEKATLVSQIRVRTRVGSGCQVWRAVVRVRPVNEVRMVRSLPIHMARASGLRVSLAGRADIGGTRKQ